MGGRESAAWPGFSMAEGRWMRPKPKARPALPVEVQRAPCRTRRGRRPQESRGLPISWMTWCRLHTPPLSTIPFVVQPFGFVVEAACAGRKYGRVCSGSQARSWRAWSSRERTWWSGFAWTIGGDSTVASAASGHQRRSPLPDARRRAVDMKVLDVQTHVEDDAGPTRPLDRVALDDRAVVVKLKIHRSSLLKVSRWRGRFLCRLRPR